MTLWIKIRYIASTILVKEQLMADKNKLDVFQEAQSEIEVMVRQILTDYLSPMQTKKISKKMIEQMCEDCASQIASKAIASSRKASTRQASRLTTELSEILNDTSWKVAPLFNDKLTNLVEQMTPADFERVKSGVATQVVSRVYRSISDFASALGIKIPESNPVVDSKDKK